VLVERSRILVYSDINPYCSQRLRAISGAPGWQEGADWGELRGRFRYSDLKGACAAGVSMGFELVQSVPEGLRTRCYGLDRPGTVRDGAEGCGTWVPESSDMLLYLAGVSKYRGLRVARCDQWRGWPGAYKT
jgi:hypothetical protein